MKIHFTTDVWHGNFHGFVAKAIESLGHEVVFFDEGGTGLDKLFRKMAVRLPRLQYAADDFVRSKVSAKWVHSVRREEPDIVLLMDYAWNVLPPAIEEVRRAGYRVIYWVTSPPTQGGAKDILAGIRFSDEVFTVDPEWMTVLFEKTEFKFLPLAGDPDVFRPLPGVKKEYDVAFVGSFAPQGWDGFIRAYALAAIPEKYKVAVFGSGVEYWHKYFPILRSRTQLARTLPFDSVNEVYNKSRIVLNLHSTSHNTSFSARTFEIALAGAFQIVDNAALRYNTDKLFPSTVLPSFASIKEMNHAIDYWLPREKEREEIAAKARGLALKNHTWQRRIQELLNSCLTPSSP